MRVEGWWLRGIEPPDGEEFEVHEVERHPACERSTRFQRQREVEHSDGERQPGRNRERAREREIERASEREGRERENPAYEVHEGAVNSVSERESCCTKCVCVRERDKEREGERAREREREEKLPS